MLRPASGPLAANPRFPSFRLHLITLLGQSLELVLQILLLSHQALKLGLQMVRKQGPVSPAIQNCVTRLEGLSDSLMRAIHRLAWELRPALLDDFGLAMALGGKAFCTMTGDVASVQAAVAAGRQVISEAGGLGDAVVISRPHPDVYREVV